MGRSRHGIINMPPAGIDQRQSLGDFYVNAACNELNKYCWRTVAAMTDYTPTRGNTLHMLFDDSDITKLQEVRGLVKPMSLQESYTIKPGVDLTINFDGAMVPTVTPDSMRVNLQRIAPLYEHVRAIKAIHDKFEEAKAVLRWLNRNATPGAIRFYYPAAMKLCPQSPALHGLQHVPSRYSIPPNIGDWTQAIKDAAATVAGTAMLPATAVTRPRNLMWLTYATTNVKLSLSANYDTDQMVYNL